MGINDYISFNDQAREFPVHGFIKQAGRDAARLPRAIFSDESAEPESTDAPLEEAVRQEHEYLRNRLREELKREPTEEELNEWLRQHTEGY
ncbi:MAG: hypothetical protein WBP93_13725 [Pyrinomonadaceae bacterium]